jgi:hypothetical protein
LWNRYLTPLAHLDGKFLRFDYRVSIHNHSPLKFRKYDLLIFYNGLLSSVKRPVSARQPDQPAISSTNCLKKKGRIDSDSPFLLHYLII